MSAIEKTSTSDRLHRLHRLFLYTTIFIILAGPQYFNEAFNVQMIVLNQFFPHFAQITFPTLLMILIANIHTKYQSVPLTASTRDIILAFAVGAIIFLEIFHAYVSGYPLELGFAYDLLLVFLCYAALKSFEYESNFVDVTLDATLIVSLFIFLLCFLAILFDFSYEKELFLENDCRDNSLITYFLTPCRPTPDYIYKLAQLTPFLTVLTTWSIFRNKRNVIFHIVLTCLLIFLVCFSKARLPWMLTLLILTLAGLFATYRSGGLKMAAAAILLGLVSLSLFVFFLGGEALDRLLSVNRGLTPEVEAEIRDWDPAEIKYSGVLMRYEQALVGLRAFAEHPIVGRGLGAAFSQRTFDELFHGIPIIYGVGYGLIGLIPFVALFFPRISVDMPVDRLFMKVSLLVVVITMALLLQHPPFWFAAAAVFLQMSHNKHTSLESDPRWP